jgi:hypothetical protein
MTPQSNSLAPSPHGRVLEGTTGRWVGRRSASFGSHLSPISPTVSGIVSVLQAYRVISEIRLVTVQIHTVRKQNSLGTV